MWLQLLLCVVMTTKAETPYCSIDETENHRELVCIINTRKCRVIWDGVGFIEMWQNGEDQGEEALLSKKKKVAVVSSDFSLLEWWE